jgi:hypothetical protein
MLRCRLPHRARRPTKPPAQIIARPIKNTAIWMNPTTGLRSQPNQLGLAPTMNTNNPVKTEIRLKRIRR